MNRFLSSDGNRELKLCTAIDDVIEDSGSDEKLYANFCMTTKHTSILKPHLSLMRRAGPSQDHIGLLLQNSQTFNIEERVDT